ncbi:MAG: RNA polymerase subunit sigma-70 [Acidobacteriota bacterium]|nr:RNA polymerase subunit sigma-70 [Acidobacteriota bacterium]
MTAEASLTEQLRLMSGGDRDVANAVMAEVLPNLRQIAVGYLARERAVTPYSPTELINEIWLRRIGRGGWHIQDRRHFYAMAAHAMRCVLVDCARARLAERRGGGASPLPLDASIPEVKWGSFEVTQLAEIGVMMERLDRLDPVAARLCDLHYFTGFTLEESAEIMKVSVRQIHRRWTRAKRWLREGLAQHPPQKTPDPGQ